MNAASPAAAIARVLTALGIVSNIVGLLNLNLTDSQQDALNGLLSALIAGAWIAYEKYHAKSLAQKTALANEAVSSGKAANVTPSPLALQISTQTNGAKT